MAIAIYSYQIQQVWGDDFTTLSLSHAATRPAGVNWCTKGLTSQFGDAAFQPAGSAVFALGTKGGESALEIKMLRDPTTGKLKSGLICNVFPDGTSAAAQTTREGYYEARLWLPDPSAGIWPAFWGIETEKLSTATRDRVMELDVLEYYGSVSPDRYITAVHDWDWNGATLQASNVINARAVIGNGIMNTGWHNYGMEIGADGSQTYFFDRVPYYYLNGSASCGGSLPSANFNSMLSTPLAWMINFAAGGGWPIDPALGTPALPASLWVSYFRIYKRVSGGAGKWN